MTPAAYIGAQIIGRARRRAAGQRHVRPPHLRGVHQDPLRRARCGSPRSSPRSASWSIIFGVVRSGRATAAPFAVGAYIGGAYFFTSSTSFANPAVTIGRTITNTFAGIRPSSAPAFIAMQLIGGALAVAAVRILYPHVADSADDVVLPHHADTADNGAHPTEVLA